MIRLTNEHYASIGRVTVESGTMDREIREYLSRLGKPPNEKATISQCLAELKRALNLQPMSDGGKGDFLFVISKIEQLIELRNALAHGVWIAPAECTDIVGTRAKGRRKITYASDISAIAAQLRLARKLVLVLVHEHCQIAAGDKRRPTASVERLKRDISSHHLRTGTP